MIPSEAGLAFGITKSLAVVLDQARLFTGIVRIVFVVAHERIHWIFWTTLSAFHGHWVPVVALATPRALHHCRTSAVVTVFCTSSAKWVIFKACDFVKAS